MNSEILRRYIKLMAIAIVVAAAFSLGYDYLTSEEPGDYYVRKGDIRLSEGNYDRALENFNLALDEFPNHRGALMGRALVFTQTQQNDEAIAEYNHLISFLEDTIEQDDLTGRGVLAAAYANRGIVFDRMGDYKAALDSYIAALRTDEDTVSGPGIVDKILYGTEDASNVRKRAQYIYEQLKLPENQRVMRRPEIDDLQRMHKP
jgi:tetratricopeptide (TPR) repeat protein